MATTKIRASADQLTQLGAIKRAADNHGLLAVYEDRLVAVTGLGGRIVAWILGYNYERSAVEAKVNTLFTDEFVAHLSKTKETASEALRKLQTRFTKGNGSSRGNYFNAALQKLLNKDSLSTATTAPGSPVSFFALRTSRSVSVSTDTVADTYPAEARLVAGQRRITVQRQWGFAKYWEIFSNPQYFNATEVEVLLSSQLKMEDLDKILVDKIDQRIKEVLRGKYPNLPQDFDFGTIASTAPLGTFLVIVENKARIASEKITREAKEKSKKIATETKQQKNKEEFVAILVRLGEGLNRGVEKPSDPKETALKWFELRLKEYQPRKKTKELITLQDLVSGKVHWDLNAKRPLQQLVRNIIQYR